MEGSESVRSRLRQIPFSSWVIAGGLTYTALALLVVFVPEILLVGLFFGSGFFIVVLVFVAMFLASSAFVLRQRRWAYVLGTAVSVVLFALFLPDLIQIASSPASGDFWVSMSVVPALILAIVLSIFSFRNAKAGLSGKAFLASRRSEAGLFTFAVIGFVLGSVLAGAIGSGVILRRAQDEARLADITIVANAPFAAVPFSPASFHIALGGKVTWVNTDTMDHTVTSDTGDPAAFDSPLLSTGDHFTFTFTVAGTYKYHCTPHPWMSGTIVVG